MKFYIDFSGYCEIEAEDREKAIEKFWDIIYNKEPLPQNVYEIENIEKKEG